MLWPLALLSPLSADIELKPGLVITESCKVKPGSYLARCPNSGLSTPAVTIRGKNIEVDFQGAILAGSGPDTPPDERSGLGLRLEGNGITVRGAVIRGYKVGIRAKGCEGLVLSDCDLSYNWRQRLLSDIEREDGADWMSFHKNGDDEWLRYGAAIYLRDCNNFTVSGTKATGGQCGIMLTGCNEGKVWNCDVSFMSGIGLGLYQSSFNRFAHNRFDWCVRGYSHGVYNRGQDSTGILVYEQSHANGFAYNSVTHGGDGFFLWAGQTTMDSGEGGCNDNVVYGNDFSHSPANGIEATFSRNVFANNLLLDCWHGVWGGYSYDTRILGNTFGYNAESIAIEHGQYNQIEGNSFVRDANAIMLWANTAAPDPSWGYPKFRDVRNVGTTVEGNVIDDVSDVAIDLGPGERISLAGNVVRAFQQAIQIRGPHARVTVEGNRFLGEMDAPAGSGLTFGADQIVASSGPRPSLALMNRGGGQIVGNEPSGDAYLSRFEQGWNPWANKGRLLPRAVSRSPLSNVETTNSLQNALAALAPPPHPNGMDPFLSQGALRGRKYILMDEWGPYDFRRPIMWPRHDGTYEILGPAGSWSVSSATNCTLSARTGTVPGSVRVTPSSGTWNVQLEYVGEMTTDSLGRVSPKGAKVAFGTSRSEIRMSWDVSWFAWDAKASDPRTNVDAFSALLTASPLVIVRMDDLNIGTAGSPHSGVPENYFATVATGSFEVEAGEYEIEVTSDDGVRVEIDGALVVDEWRYQGPTSFRHPVTLKAGKHTLRVRHFEIDGYTALKVRVRAA